MSKLSVSKLDRAKTALILDHPFFASILLKKPLALDSSVPTACINASGRIRVSPDFIEALTVQQIVFLLAHECMHWIMDTFGRQGGRPMKGWNIATDAVNNELLISSGVGEFIEGGVRWPGAENMTAEEVYNQLDKNDKQDNGGQQGGGQGDSSSGSGDGYGDGPGGIGSDLDPATDDGQPMSPAEAKANSARIKAEIVSAKEVAKQMGNMPASIGRLIDKLIHVKTPWHQIMERFMTERIRCDYTWTRPNRRFIAQGMYLPSMAGVGMGEVAIIVDTSASVSQHELTVFGSHTSRIMEVCQPTAIHVIYVDASVSRVDSFTVDDLPLQFDPSGGGGTDMRVGTDYVTKHMPEAACMVLLTDGYTPYPDSVSIPLITATTGSKAAPVGETVYIEV